MVAASGRKPILSPSALSTWINCRRSYLFRYIDRLPSATSTAHFSLGNSLHAALREYVIPLGERKPIDELLNTYWQTAGYRDQEMSDTIKRIAHVWLEQYLINEGDIPAIAVERKVGYPFEHFELTGRIDRIDSRIINDEKQLVIVDYKTGAGIPTAQEAKSSMALAFYAVATWREWGITCATVELHHLPSGTRAVATHDDESLSRHRSRLVDLAEEVVAATALDTANARVREEHFPPTVNGLCAWCAFREHCEPGRTAYEAAEPWRAVEDIYIEAKSLDY